MLLKNRINFPRFGKSPLMAKKKAPVYLKNNSRQLPLEIQEIICFMVLGEDASNSFSLTAMRVCKTWASFICERMYKNYKFKGYIEFIGFVNTISLKRPLLPYNLYVQHIDLSPVNKYGVDARVRRLIKYCPNIRSIQLGHTTSVKADTLQLMAKHCDDIHTLQMGSIQSFPFMFDCDFSGMTGLRNISFKTTPLQSDSLQTLPTSLRRLQLIQMDALQHDEFFIFLKRHQKIKALSIHRCKHINTKLAMLLDQLPRLQEFELCGHEINDLALQGFFDKQITLHTLKICNTQISDTTLEAITNGALVVHYLDLSNNANISKYGVTSLLRKKQFKELIL